jgi:hypothetical protein
MKYDGFAFPPCEIQAVTAPVCRDCGVSLKPFKRSRMQCRSCMCREISSTPEARAKISAAMKRHWNDADARARHEAAIAAWLQRPETAQIYQTAGREAAARRLSWCPPAYRDLYQYLRRGKEIPAAQARAMTEAQITADIKAAQAGRLDQAAFVRARDAAHYLGKTR